MQPSLIIEGSRINDIPSFYEEINRVFMTGEDWKLGNSLDAFNDLLYGGFGALHGNETVTLIWRDMHYSKEALGLETTRKYYEAKLLPGSPYDKNIARQKLEELHKGIGQTYFDILMEIISEHSNIHLEPA